MTLPGVLVRVLRNRLMNSVLTVSLLMVTPWQWLYESCGVRLSWPTASPLVKVVYFPCCGVSWPDYNVRIGLK